MIQWDSQWLNQSRPRISSQKRESTILSQFWNVSHLGIVWKSESEISGRPSPIQAAILGKNFFLKRYKSSELQRQSVIVRGSNRKCPQLFLKGAPEAVAARCANMPAAFEDELG